VRSLLIDPFNTPYMQRALVEAVILGVMAAMVGVHVVLRRLAFLADTFTHTVFPGLAVAFAAGTSVLIGALVAGALSALVFTVLDRSRRITPDAALAVVLTSFFSVGVIVISRTDRYTADLTTLLFGQILTVDSRQIVETAVLAVAVGLVLLALDKELRMRAFDPEGARALGYRIGILDLAMNLLIVLVVVAAARAVGTVLTVALLITPAATARLFARSVGSMYALAALVGAGAGWIGLAVSYEASIHHDLRLAAGATIVLVATVVFLAALAARSAGRFVSHRALRPTTTAMGAAGG